MPAAHSNSAAADASLGDVFDWSGSLDRALDRAVLESERRRLALVAGVVGVCLLTFLTFLALPGRGDSEMRRGLTRQAPWVVTLYAAVIAYELAARAFVGRRLRAGRPVPAVARYLTVLVEVSLPTLLILQATHIFNPLDALFAPPSLFYLIVIILTTLQLDARLSVFAGLAAGVQYLVLALSVLHATRPGGGGATAAAAAAAATTTRMMADPAHHVIRAGTMALCGVVAAFVARRIRAQFEQSVRSVQERDRAVSVFGQHVSPQVAQTVLRQHVGAAAGPEVREVCVMFLDLRGFTAFADGRQPAEVMDYLNALFGFMIEVVNRHGGIINKFLGDGFMAVFGAPVADGEAPRHAVQAALEIVARLDRMNGDSVNPPARVGIGLHAGPAVTGNVGSERRKEYTVIGDVVNLASRIEALNKQFDSRVLASEAVYAAAAAATGDGELRVSATPLGPVEVRGQRNKVNLFRLA